MGLPEIKNGIIGIVGGIGPLAGIGLSTKIVNHTIAAKDQEHIPQILYSLPEIIGDRTEFLEGAINENPAFNLVAIILKLEQQGCTVVAMACNTAYSPRIFSVIVDELKKKDSKIRLLHIVDETGLFIKKYYPHVKNVGILGTTGTYNSKLYSSLSESGLNVLNISLELQNKVHSAIYHPDYGIKAMPKGISARSKEILTEAAESLISMGAGLIVLGCTELPLAFTEPTFNSVPLVDTTTILARALIHAHSPHKLKTWEF